LYLAQNHGAEILAENEVYDVLQIDSKDGTSGYKLL
jgi:cholesterol oxidase